MSVPVEIARDMIEFADPHPAIRHAAANRLKDNAHKVMLNSAVWDDLVDYLERHKPDIAKGSRDEDLAFLHVFAIVVYVLGRDLGRGAVTNSAGRAAQRLLPFSRDLANDSQVRSPAHARTAVVSIGQPNVTEDARIPYCNAGSAFTHLGACSMVFLLEVISMVGLQET